MLQGPIADLILRIVLDEEKFEMPRLPPVVGGTWGGVSLEGLWGPLRVDGPGLLWDPEPVRGAPATVGSTLDRFESLRNKPALLKLADGSTIVADFGHWKSQGRREGMTPGYTCEFHVWRCEAPRVFRWVGELKGGGFLNANLGVSSPGKSSGGNMRLDGRYVWYLLANDRIDGEANHRVIVDGGPRPLNREALGTDFNALQFALGTPLQIDSLVGLDEPGNVVGCAGVHLGGNRRTAKRRRADGPVPDEISDDCWIPVLFHRLATTMAARDLPWGVACNAYVDSASDATIDAKYLKLHVALEAFATALPKVKGQGEPARFLVKDKKAWNKWVKAHDGELRSMVAPDANPESFIGKVRSAMNLPSSGVVADALGRLSPPLLVDEKVLAELDYRNLAAHDYRMNGPDVDYDVDRDVGRVDILRSLLVALVARASEYDGAISGWVTSDAAGWKPQPDWWPAPSSSAIEAARASFLCERGQRRPIRPRAFRSRLRTKSATGLSSRSRRV
jgi:hypothetical protein